jgi:hypothetical protein
MNDKDPVMIDLDRYLNTQDEDYIDPYERERARQEYLADSMDGEDTDKNE